MATPVLMPRAGQSVETCLIVGWKKKAGEAVKAGETLAEAETDKAVVEVESPADGTLLAIFVPEGEYAAVMTHIAAIGAPGEDVAALRPDGAVPAQAPAAIAGPAAQAAAAVQAPPPLAVNAPADATAVGVSPRARHLAESHGVQAAALAGSGPGGRVIERDVRAALEGAQPLTPLAKAALAPGQRAPAEGSGPGGRVLAADLAAPAAKGNGHVSVSPALPDETKEIPLKGVRKLIADRMLASLQGTAQLTLNASADARALQAYRAKLKASHDDGLRSVTLNDLVLFAVARILAKYPDLNALFTGDKITQHSRVHLGFAVDTPRGLMVPVIRDADTLSLRQLATEAKRLAKGCLEGGIQPDELNGGTFTVSNLGNLGVESFTPVLNPPQVGILGVGAIGLKPVQQGEKVEFHPHVALSLTINHQVVDGAPGARFLQALSQALANIELALAG